MATTVIITDEGSTQIVNNDEILHIDTIECRDFDYASNLIEEVLADNNLEGPEQMRLVFYVAEEFLSYHSESPDFDQYVIIDPSVSD